MPLHATLFLKLLTAHVVGDYLLQPDRLARDKPRPTALAVHLLAHAVMLVLVVVLTEPWDAQLGAVLAGVVLLHGAIDAWTGRFARRGLGHLAIDQAMHLAVLVMAVAVARPAEFSGGLGFAARGLGDPGALTTAAGFVVAVFAGAVVVGRTIQPLSVRVLERFGASHPGLIAAGRVIGLWERTLIFLAVMAGIETLVGFVIAAKAILRLPEAREQGGRELSEYYLIGTLASVTWSLVVGLIVRAMLRRMATGGP